MYLTLFEVKNYKVVFVQKELFFMGPPFFEKLISLQSKLIYDFDDAIWMRDVSEGNKRFAFLKNSSKTKEIIKISDLVIVGNEFLKRYALQYNQNVKIIPTCVDTEKYKRSKPYKDNSELCIGWSGSQTTTKHFDILSDVLYKLKQKYNNKILYKLIGDENYSNEKLSVKGIKWTYNTEIQNLEEIDIGIMPLPSDKWSEGKCGLKGLVYMSMEIPAVMSPVGVNKDIVSEGENGFLCTNEEDWINTLSNLIDNFQIRKDIGKQGRETILKEYSVEINQHLFYSAIFSIF